MLQADNSLVACSVLLGIGLDLIISEFLIILVQLSLHCQRATANATHLIGIVIGISLGVAYACYCEADAESMLYAAKVVSITALIFFGLITYPYYKKKGIQ